MTANITIIRADGRTDDIELPFGAYLIGREAGHIVLGDPLASGSHARLDVHAAGVTITDLGSANGTFDADGQRLVAPANMALDRPMRLGNSQLVLRGFFAPSGGTLMAGTSAAPPVHQASAHHYVPAQPPPVAAQAAPAGMQRPEFAQPGSQPAKRKSRAAGLALGAAVGLAAIAAIGVAVAKWSGPPPRPLPTGALPKDIWSLTKAVGTALRPAGYEPPDQARWSAMSERYCGGIDIFIALLTVEDGPLGTLPKTLGDPELRDELRQTLECGKRVAEARDLDITYSLTVGDPDRPLDRYTVELEPLGLERVDDPGLAVARADDPDHMEGTQCQVQSPRSRCDDRSRTIAKLQGHDIWLSGRKIDLDRFADDYSEDADHESRSLELLEELTDELRGYDFVWYTRADSVQYRDPVFVSLTGSPAGWNGWSGTSSSVEFRPRDRDRVARAAERLADEMRDAEAFAVGMSGELEWADEEAIRLVIVAEDESAAERIKTEYDAYLKDLKEALDDAEPARSSRSHSQSRLDSEFARFESKVSEDRIKQAKEGLDGLEVSQTGVRLELEFSFELGECTDPDYPRERVPV